MPFDRPTSLSVVQAPTVNPWRVMVSHCSGSWPKIRVDPRVRLSRHATNGGELALPVDADRWQVFVDEGSSEVAAVTADDEGSRFGPDPDGLMACRVTVGEQAGHGAVTEQVMVRGDLVSIVSVVDVVGVVGPAADHLVVVSCCPFSGLDNDARVGELDQSPDVIEVQMGQHHLLHLTGVEARRTQQRTGGARTVRR